MELPTRFRDWKSVAAEPKHPLAALDGRKLARGRIRVLLGRTSRFGARYFALLLEDGKGQLSEEPILTGLHHSGPLPGYNWIEVADTNERVASRDEIELLFSLLLEAIPPGGHLMVEYDSPSRAETARELAHGVPAIATQLGEMLFRLGCGAHFKDWQIAEGGSEGPRKLQAYKSPSRDHAARWKREASRELRSFLDRPASESNAAARERAAALLRFLHDEADR